MSSEPSNRNFVDKELTNLQAAPVQTTAGHDNPTADPSRDDEHSRMLFRLLLTSCMKGYPRRSMVGWSLVEGKDWTDGLSARHRRSPVVPALVVGRARSVAPPRDQGLRGVHIPSYIIGRRIAPQSFRMRSDLHRTS